jgi:alpha-D-ribose 1-methylphosphonate 5-triphosphate synthase subunit PhnG
MFDVQNVTLTRAVIMFDVQNVTLTRAVIRFDVQNVTLTRAVIRFDVHPVTITISSNNVICFIEYSIFRLIFIDWQI